MYYRNPNENPEINIEQMADNSYSQNRKPCCDNNLMPSDSYSAPYDDPPMGMHSHGRPPIMPYPHYPNVHVIVHHHHHFHHFMPHRPRPYRAYEDVEEYNDYDNMYY